jgi:hypothetical protein
VLLIYLPGRGPSGRDTTGTNPSDPSIARGRTRSSTSYCRHHDTIMTHTTYTRRSEILDGKRCLYIIIFELHPVVVSSNLSLALGKGNICMSVTTGTAATSGRCYITSMTDDITIAV